MPAYAPILTPSDLTNAYPEIVAEITRNTGDIDTNTLALEAIATAIDEVKMYLTRYDLVQLFGDPTVTEANPSGIAASFSDNKLNRMVKTIAIWELMQLANANIMYEMMESRYKMTVATLKDIQKGVADPKWPYLDITTETSSPSDEVYAISQKKRNNTGFEQTDNTNCHH